MSFSLWGHFHDNPNKLVVGLNREGREEVEMGVGVTLLAEVEEELTGLQGVAAGLRRRARPRPRPSSCSCRGRGQVGRMGEEGVAMGEEGLG